MICKKCGKEIKDTAKFCGYCGSVNEPTIGVQTPEISETVNYTPSWMKQEVKTTTSTISAKQNVDIKTEISKNAGLVALPCIYLVWQIIRIFLNRNMISYGNDSYMTYMYITIIVGCILYGAISGGLVIAINKCSKNFKWVYLIPYMIVCAYFLLTSINYFESVLYSIFEFLEIIVSMVVIISLQNTQLGKEKSAKSTITIAAISTGAGVLVFRFLYYLLISILFGGFVSFTLWNVITSAASILGAVITSAVIVNSAYMKNSQR
ncbi:MAG: zinc ribbon domain-containing protein [Acutalibacteraceae bacterium]|nr:zinc ribbon domain-containing protein [Acutalibacteraceae bacterium]